MKTKKLYDIDAYATAFEAVVLSCEKTDVLNSCDGNENIYAVILDQTLFFPEEGGQTPDQGNLNGQVVCDVQIKDDVITHFVSAPLEVGQKVKGEICWKHRFYNMQQHSAEHIFSGLAYKKYGSKNIGFHLSNQIVTMDFDRGFSETELEEMELAVNEAITANAEIKTGYPSQEELEKMEYRSKLDLTDGIRIVEIMGYDICACCAPHVHRTGEIGCFKIQYAQNYKGGMRISFLCGFRALEEYRKKAKIISELSGILTTNQDNLADHVSKLKTQVQSLKTQLNSAKQELLESKIKTIPENQKNVLLFERDIDTPVMRNIVNQLVEKHEGLCGVFVGTEGAGYNFIIGSKNINCKDAASKLREALDARGGGSNVMVQGSVAAPQIKIEEVLDI